MSSGRSGTLSSSSGSTATSTSDGAIARGEIDDERFAWLVTTFKQLETDGLTAGDTTITPDEYANAWRVLVLHHHVVSLNAARSIAGRFVQLFTAHTTVLKGSERLVQLIRHRIDVVLHGHEHLPVCFREPAAAAIIVSAGTASEWTGASYANSFYVITLYDDRTMEVEEHVWTGCGFSNQSRDGRTLFQRFSVPRFRGECGAECLSRSQEGHARCSSGPTRTTWRVSGRTGRRSTIPGPPGWECQGFS